MTDPAVDVDSSVETLSFIGFRIGEGLTRNTESEWDMLREQLRYQQRSVIKHEVTTVDIDDVYFTQTTCPNQFRDGRSLTELMHSLHHKLVDPMEDDLLILNVIQVAVRLHKRSGAQSRCMYTLDHRRLKCMKDAGCTKLRVRIILANSPPLNVNKAIGRIGCRRDVHVKRRRCA